MRLEDLFASVLEVPESDLTDESGPNSVPNWDSFAQVALIAGMEEVYGVSLKIIEIQSIKSIGDARRILQCKGVKV
jgi:acyl carrier protein